MKKNIMKWDELTFAHNWRLSPVLQIDIRDGEVRNDLVYRSNSIPINVYNGLVLEFYIPKTADPTMVVSALENGDWDHLFERIIAGAEVWWDGSNRRGRLDDDAAEAADELQATLDELHGTGKYAHADPDDCFPHGWLGPELSGLSREDIERLADELCEQALEDGAYIEREEMIKYLEHLRARTY